MTVSGCQRQSVKPRYSFSSAFQGSIVDGCICICIYFVCVFVNSSQSRVVTHFHLPCTTGQSLMAVLVSVLVFLFVIVFVNVSQLSLVTHFHLPSKDQLLMAVFVFVCVVVNSSQSRVVFHFHLPSTVGQLLMAVFVFVCVFVNFSQAS